MDDLVIFNMKIKKETDVMTTDTDVMVVETDTDVMVVETDTDVMVVETDTDVMVIETGVMVMIETDAMTTEEIVLKIENINTHQIELEEWETLRNGTKVL